MGRHSWRSLNQQIHKDLYTIPCIEDILDKLLHVQWFTKIELTQSYNQIQIAPAYKLCSTFLTCFGPFEQVVMTFRLPNMPSSFDCLMNRILFYLLKHFVVVYLNDILLYKASLSKHQGYMLIILQCLHDKHCFSKAKKVYLSSVLS